MTADALASERFEIDWSAQTILPIDFQGHEIALEARAYQGVAADDQAIVLIRRAAGADGAVAPLVRVHSGCVTGDVFHSLRCDCRAQLDAALGRIVAAPVGVLIYLPSHEGRGIGLFNKIRAYALQDQGFDTVDANLEIGSPIDAREYSLAARILLDLGFPKIELLTNNPAKVEALRAEGIEVAGQAPLVIAPGRHNRKYLETKRRRMRHKL